ncbi:hypothetical protein Ntsu_81740 [Nocardia sp. IFM 10818]
MSHVLAALTALPTVPLTLYVLLRWGPDGLIRLIATCTAVLSRDRTRAERAVQVLALVQPRTANANEQGGATDPALPPAGDRTE